MEMSQSTQKGFNLSLSNGLDRKHNSDIPYCKMWPPPSVATLYTNTQIDTFFAFFSPTSVREMKVGRAPPPFLLLGTSVTSVLELVWEKGEGGISEWGEDNRGMRKQKNKRIGRGRGGGIGWHFLVLPFRINESPLGLLNKPTAPHVARSFPHNQIKILFPLVFYSCTSLVGYFIFLGGKFRSIGVFAANIIPPNMHADFP